MLSFKPLDESCIFNITERARGACASLDEEYLAEALYSFLSFKDEDIECCADFAHGCLLVRIFDMGRYSFVYPISVAFDSDESAAVLSLRDYALREEIPLILTDVPLEGVTTLASNFRHTCFDATDELSYRATVMSEIALRDGVPSLLGERIELSQLRPEDTAAYARLCRDENVNKYWGYDYRSDIEENVSDDYFLHEAQSEYNRSVALTLAARLDGEFIGDAVLYAFDLCGGAEIGFRLLPEWQGKGLGGELVETLCDYAKRLGLLRLRAEVMKENTRSVRLLCGLGHEFSSDNDKNIFDIEL